ncbi:MAG: PQQ-binding-like beta-propeller repeat protein [Deltaproteobacteria bacterium]|nr:PQQ-binding-like beta-propeller repeat protein [Deltaproteobacteria bacterium]
MRSGLVVLLLGAASLAGCALAKRPPPDRVIRWSGEVRITQDVVLARGTRLVIEPGTRVLFAFRDDDGDGWGDASIRIEGDLTARGTRERPIVFAPADGPARPGRWGEVRVDFGRVEMSRCVVEGSTRGIHAHFTRGRITDSVFRRNVDGTRLGNSELEVTRNLFYGHPGKAYNAHRSRNRVEANRFHHNRTALFLFEEDAGSEFVGNRLRDNDVPLRPGDFFTGSVVTRGNDWGGSPPRPPEGNPGVRIDASPARVAWAGPEGWPGWDGRWSADLGGFVDAPARPTDEGVYAASWAGRVVRLGVLDGRVRAEALLPDAVDAGPALGPGTLAVWSWDRGLYLLSRPDLTVLDRTESTPSPADDHRQSAPAFAGSTLFAAGWDGRVRAFETREGRLAPRWTFEGDGPFRAPLTLAAGLVLAPCQDGTLYALDPATGALRWSHRAEAPLLSRAAAGQAGVFVADRSGVLHALDPVTGRERWTRDLGAPVWYGGPRLGRDALYLGDDRGRLHAVDPRSGRQLWQVPLGGGVRSAPLVLGDRALVVTTLGGWAYLLDPATGTEWDAWPVGEGAQADPAALGSTVFVGTREQGLLCLEVRGK